MFSGGGRGNSKTSTPPEIPSCIIFGVAKTTGSFPVSSELQRPTTLDETWFYFTIYYDSTANLPSFSRDIHHLPSDKIALFKEKKYISITSCLLPVQMLKSKSTMKLSVLLYGLFIDYNVLASCGCSKMTRMLR